MGKPEQFSLKKRAILVVLVVWMSFDIYAMQINGDTLNYPTKNLEHLNYRLSLGWFEIGEANYWVSESTDNFIHLQSQISGSRFVGIFAKLEACMESVVKPQSCQPVKSHRDFQFARSIDVRTNWFDFADSVRIKAFVEDINTWRFHSFPLNQGPIFDLLGTIEFLRNQDPALLMDGTPFRLNTFYSNDLFPLTLAFAGNEWIEWKDVPLLTRKFILTFPQNKYFPEGKEIVIYTMTRKKEIPVLVVVGMNLGDFVLELQDFKL